MILKGEADFMREFETVKAEIFPRISREKIKKIMKALKKNSENQKSEFQSNNVVTFQ